MDNSTKILIGLLGLGAIYLLYENMQLKKTNSNKKISPIPTQTSFPTHHNAYPVPVAGQKPAPTPENIIRRAAKKHNLANTPDWV